MQVKMLKKAAGPERVLEIGKVYAVPDVVGAALIDAGAAEQVDVVERAVPQAEVETPEDPAPAPVKRRPGRPRKKKAKAKAKSKG